MNFFRKNFTAEQNLILAKNDPPKTCRCCPKCFSGTKSGLKWYKTLKTKVKLLPEAPDEVIFFKSVSPPPYQFPSFASYWAVTCIITKKSPPNRVVLKTGFLLWVVFFRFFSVFFQFLFGFYYWKKFPKKFENHNFAPNQQKMVKSD